MTDEMGTAVPSVILTVNSNDVWESTNGCSVLTEGIVPLTWVIYVRGNAHLALHSIDCFIQTFTVLTLFLAC